MPLLLLACATGTIRLDDTASLDEPAPADTATDTGSEPDTDIDTDPDTEPAPSDAGAYRGLVDGTYRYPDWGGDEERVACSGAVAFTIDAEGLLSGEAGCGTDGLVLTGPVEGADAGGVLDARWTVDLGWESVAFTLTGTVDDGAFTLALFEDMGRGGTFEAEMSGERD